MTSVAIFSMPGAVCAVIAQVSVERDWVPKLFPPSELAVVNARFSRIDLICEVFSPVVGGVFLATMGPMWGFFLVVLTNLCTFLPEWLLLRRVHYRHRMQLAKRVEPSPNMFSPSAYLTFKDNPWFLLASVWAVFVRQPAALLIVSLAMVYFTVLSPHGMLLTAFLASVYVHSLGSAVSSLLISPPVS